MATVYLKLNGNQISISGSYIHAANGIYKNVLGGSWDGSAKEWDVDLKYASALKFFYGTAHVEVIIAPGSQAALEAALTELDAPLVDRLTGAANAAKEEATRLKTVILKSSNGFSVAASGDFDSDNNAFWKTVCGAKWNPDARAWIMSGLVAFLAVDYANATGFRVEISPDVIRLAQKRTTELKPSTIKKANALIASAKRRAAAQKVVEPAFDSVDACLASLKRPLFPFQVDGVKEIVTKFDGRCLLADEMGLGKTSTALAVAAYYSDYPCLIVAPAGQLETWKREITTVIGTPAEEIAIVRGGKSQVPAGTKYVITTFGTLRSDFTKITAEFPGTVLIDEAHALKGSSSTQAAITLPICKDARRVLLLTGTPAVNKVEESYLLANAVNSALYSNAYAFKARAGRGIAEELRSTVMVRRLKKDVMSQLPSKTRKQVMVSLDDLDATDFRKSQKILRAKIEKAVSKYQGDYLRIKASLVSGKNALDLNETIFTAMRQLGEAKMPAVCQYVGELLENDGLQAIVFGHHKNVIAGIEAWATENNISFVSITGDTAPALRQGLVDSFQAGKARIAIMSIKAGGVGLTLTAGSEVVFAEGAWTPSALDQAESRAHRIGQKESVTCHYLTVADTIDAAVFERVVEKSASINHGLDAGANDEFKADEVSDDGIIDTALKAIVADVCKQLGFTMVVREKGEEAEQEAEAA